MGKRYEQLGAAHRYRLPVEREDGHPRRRRRLLQHHVHAGVERPAQVLALPAAAGDQLQPRCHAGLQDHRRRARLRQHAGDRRLAAEPEQPHAVLAAVEPLRPASAHERHDARRRLCRLLQQEADRLRGLEQRPHAVPGRHRPAPHSGLLRFHRQHGRRQQHVQLRVQRLPDETDQALQPRACRFSPTTPGAR